MICDTNDQNLLLLAHNELSPLARLATLWHLRTCNRCQQRERQMAAASQQIASSLRPDGLAPWKPAKTAAPLGALPQTAMLVLLTALLALVLLTTILVVNRTRVHGPRPAPTSFSIGCRPDLPNDKCR